jgi:leukotriene-A4 hydrolase
MDYLLEYEPFDFGTLDQMESLYKFSEMKNCEIKFRWHMICLKAGYVAKYSDVVNFVTSVGRMKYVRPLYRAFAAAKDGAELAKKTFIANQKFYHPICSNMVRKDLKL